MSSAQPGAAARTEGSGRLQRLSRVLLITGLTLLTLSLVLQASQFEGEAPFRGELVVVLVAQLFTVVGGAALTGSAFGYLLHALRADIDGAKAGQGRDPGVNWFE